MNRTCGCGNEMELMLHTIIYSHRFEIENVPVWSCEQCEQSQLHDEIKEDLKEMIYRLSRHENSGKFRFDEYNELANYIHMSSNPNVSNCSEEQYMERRVDELLDLLIIVNSLGDDEWMQDLHRRLTQLTKYTFITSDSR